MDRSLAHEAAVRLASQVVAQPAKPPAKMRAWMKQQRSRGGATWAGACAFCAYAEGQTPDDGGPVACRGVPCPSSVRLQPSLLQDDVVCFDNHQETRDRLCILRDFERGRSNVEAIPPARRSSALRTLFEGVLRDAELRGRAPPEKLCLNPRRHASVPWTHVHGFSKGLNPDGGVEDHAYCVDFGRRG